MDGVVQKRLSTRKSKEYHAFFQLEIFFGALLASAAPFISLTKINCISRHGNWPNLRYEILQKIIGYLFISFIVTRQWIYNVSLARACSQLYLLFGCICSGYQDVCEYMKTWEFILIVLQFPTYLLVGRATPAVCVPTQMQRATTAFVNAFRRTTKRTRPAVSRLPIFLIYSSLIPRTDFLRKWNQVNESVRLLDFEWFLGRRAVDGSGRPVGRVNIFVNSGAWVDISTWVSSQNYLRVLASSWVDRVGQGQNFFKESADPGRKFGGSDRANKKSTHGQTLL